jgi:hypothetical protein
MPKIDLEEIFFDFFDATKAYIPDSDHVLVCIDIIRTLEDYGYDLSVLRGHDDAVDEALDEVFPDMAESYNAEDDDLYDR